MQSKIEQQVMGSVAVIYGARQLMSRAAMSYYALAGSSVVLWQLTWVHKIFENLAAVEQGGVGAVLHYLSYAVMHTQTSVQATLAVGAIAFATLVFDKARASAAPRGYFVGA